MASPVLDERSRDVLKSLIQLHIATGAPVGSDSLSRALDRSLSPAAIAHELHTSGVSPHEVMENASHLLSRLSHQVGFVLAPEMRSTSFRHIDLVRLPHPRILVVMVSGAGLVTHKVIEMEEELTQEDLQACANYLNTHFTGMTLATIRARLLEMMGEDAALYDWLLKPVVSVG